MVHTHPVDILDIVPGRVPEAPALAVAERENLVSTNPLNDPASPRGPSDVSLSRLMKGDHAAAGTPPAAAKHEKPARQHPADGGEAKGWDDIQNRFINPSPIRVVETPSMFTKTIPEAIPVTAPQRSSLLSADEMIDGENAPVECADFDAAAKFAVNAMRTHIGRLSSVENLYHNKRGQTVSPETVRQYGNKFRWLLDRYHRQSGVYSRRALNQDFTEEESFNPVAFVNWLCSLRSTVEDSTWRFYKASVMFHIERLSHPDAPTAEAILIGVDGDPHEEGRMGRGDKTTKYVRFEDYQKLLKYCLDVGVADGSMNLGNFAWAAIRTGMRPSEWATCDIRTAVNPEAPHGRNVWLFVCNAKASNGRANGLVRVLDLSAISDNNLEPIWATMWLFRRLAPVEGTKGVIRRIRQLMAHACKRMGISVRYSPYSFRHQAIANWKTIYSSVEVAALAGHSIPATAARHYAKSRDGWTGGALRHDIIITPSRLDVQRVVDRLHNGSPELLLRPDGSMVPRSSDDPTAEPGMSA